MPIILTELNEFLKSYISIFGDVSACDGQKVSLSKKNYEMFFGEIIGVRCNFDNFFIPKYTIKFFDCKQKIVRIEAFSAKDFFKINEYPRYLQ
jgi:hypothetical protein